MSTEFNKFNTPAHASSPALGFGQAAEIAAAREPVQKAALNLRIVRGPLQPQQNQSIISQYNSLASEGISTADFLRWIQNSPEGPAWHAILETIDGDIVGHTSLIPIPATYNGRPAVAAKSEFSFIREEYRAAKIRGFEQSGRLKNLIYIDELFKLCRAEGWSPLLISTSSSYHRVFRSIACYPVNFPLWECLLVLRPGKAASGTPNLQSWQRASLWGTGLIQTTLWSPALLFSDRSELRRFPAHEKPLPPCGQKLVCFQDKESLLWRYPEEQYTRIAESGQGADLIVKHGSDTRYLRVCQWQSGVPTAALITELVQMARQQRALGVRWAVYEGDAGSAAIVSRLRSLGFLCAKRVRTLLINTAERELLECSKWHLTDAMFSFDH
jgi:hypothetical protein